MSMTSPPPELAAEILDHRNGFTDNAIQRPPPVWNKHSDGVLAEIGPVMGAVSWPPLSESTRVSSKALADGVVSQGNGIASASSQRQISTDANPNSTPNHTIPTPPNRSMRHNGTGTSSNNGVSQLPAPLGPLIETVPNHSFPSDSRQRTGSASQSLSANDHLMQHSSIRSRNENPPPHPRGGNSHHDNHRGRRDQDRGNQDRNARRNFNGKDSYMQPHRGLPRFPRPPPPPPISTPYIPPPSVPPFGSPIGFPELASPMYYVPRGMPFVAPITTPAMFFPALDINLRTLIANQIDYYFSNENLIRDTYLRQNMDDQGWVSIKLIAGFKKIKHLTENISFILDAVKTSNNVEVQGDKVRKRNDWIRWILSTSLTNSSSSQS